MSYRAEAKTRSTHGHNARAGRPGEPGNSQYLRCMVEIRRAVGAHRRAHVGEGSGGGGGERVAELSAACVLDTSV